MFRQHKKRATVRLSKLELRMREVLDNCDHYIWTMSEQVLLWQPQAEGDLRNTNNLSKYYYSNDLTVMITPIPILHTMETIS